MCLTISCVDTPKVLITVSTMNALLKDREENIPARLLRAKLNIASVNDFKSQKLRSDCRGMSGLSVGRREHPVTLSKI